MFRINLFVFLIVALSLGCNNYKQEEKKVPPPEGIFLDYRVWGEEESGKVTVRLQYLWGSPEGEPVSIDPPAKVEWDGADLMPDSSKMNGLYYELELPFEGFDEHKVTFTDKTGTVYETKIDFINMKLKDEIPETVKKDELILELVGLKEREDIQVVLSDTSFYGKGIDRIYVAKKGKVTIPKSYMSRLKTGPVTMEIIYENYRAIEPAPPGGGELMRTYTIKREFQLVDHQ